VIEKRRQERPFNSISDFLEVLKPMFGREREKKEITKVFQALRIEVNREMSALEEMLGATAEVLRPGGRLVVMSYHSLEDRMVKNFVKAGNISGNVEQDFYGNVNAPFRNVGKLIVPTEEEIARNPRSRSAKLRIAERNDKR
jgi:16S rRNA (cytosine1402-N4)-methyltransferase